MNLDRRNSIESSTENDINKQIATLEYAIQSEFNISKNTLWNLLNFKKASAQKEKKEQSIDYRKALIWEIQRLSGSWEIHSDLSNEQSIVLADKVISLEKLKEKTQSGIKELREEILSWQYNNNLFWSEGLSISWSKKTREKIDNPKWLWDHIVWLWVWIVETGVVLTKMSWEILLWILKSPVHVVELIRGKAELNTHIKI